MRVRVALALVATSAAVAGLPAFGGPPASPASPASPAAAAADPTRLGAFERAFEEPGPRCYPDGKGGTTCKPAAVSVVPLADGEVLYWDGLEGMEDVQASTVAEIGHKAGNDQSRLLDLRGARPYFSIPTPADGGSNPGGNANEYLPGPLHNNERTDNDGDLFCSSQVHLYDGRVLNTGGTSYYQEPGVPGIPYGVAELEGIKNTKTYDPPNRRWQQSGSMKYGRWYPTTVTLADGKVFVASGVTKLIKPVYADHPQDSGDNVRQTETYDPSIGRWFQNPATADKSLPLFPRLHLLPNGKVYYDAAGQAFNPSGASYNEASWNYASVYDPEKHTWRDLDIPAFGSAKGFRGSTFSQMLTLKPPYTRAQFLSAGGVYGPTPGTYVATATSTLNTVDVTPSTETFKSEAVGHLNQARWYSTGVTLPTGQVLAISGADRDEVLAPGTGKAVTQVEMFDPLTRTWSALASAAKQRTYHNTATLLADGRVLVGGHSPINTLYSRGNENTLHHHAGTSPADRDPSFEIYSPPYLFWGARPVIQDYSQSLPYTRTTRIETSHAGEIASVVLVRNPALTHLVDADQRVVELPIINRDGDGVTVATPPYPSVAPPGPYWLFVNRRTPKGLVPSVARQVFVGTPAPWWVPKYVVSKPGASPSPSPKPKPPAKPGDDDKGKKKGHDKQCEKHGRKCDEAPAPRPAALPEDTPATRKAAARTPVAPLAAPLVLLAAALALARRGRRGGRYRA